MDQVIFGGSGIEGNNLLDTASPVFNYIQGRIAWTTTEENNPMLVSTPGTIKKLRMTLSGIPGSGNSYTLVLMVDGVASALTVTVSGGVDISGQDLVNEVSVSAGQEVYMRCTPSSTPTARSVTWSTIFTGDNAAESIFLSGSHGNTLDQSTTEHAALSAGNIPNATLTLSEQMIALSGTIKNLYVKLTADPGTDPDGYKFTVYKNGIATSLTVTITANATTANDTSNSFTVVATDTLVLKIEPLNAPSVAPKAYWGTTLVADTDGEWAILGGSGQTINDSINNWANLVGSAHGGVWTTSDVSRVAQTQACSLKNLYVKLSADPGTGIEGYEFSVEVNTTASALLSVTIRADDTTGNNTSDTIVLSDDDFVQFQVSPLDNPTVEPSVLWGMVAFVSIVSSTGGGMGRSMMAAGFI